MIVNSYDAVCIENLNMKSMSETLNFGKSVHDNGWGMFVRMLEYKLEALGKRLIKIDKYYPSSQVCSVCEYQNKDTKDISIREWTCPDVEHFMIEISMLSKTSNMQECRCY